MRAVIVYLTENGKRLGEIISNKKNATLIGKEQWGESLQSFVAKNFHSYDQFIMIMAAGIAVRMIAPFLESKQTDPAVVVLDEKGRFVVSLLSGHLGGANFLANEIAAITGGQSVITTATDVNGMIAFDNFAKENDCFIENIEELKFISSDIVNGKQIGIFGEQELCGLPQYLDLNNSHDSNVLISARRKYTKAINGHVLRLVPKKLVLGIGCKRGVSLEAIEEAVGNFLEKNNWKEGGLCCVCSIELKKEEKGILEFCKKRGLPFLTLKTEFLQSVEHEFECSSFVKKNVGVGNVCEACAVYAKQNVRLVCGKSIYSGITLALGEIIYMYKFV